MLWWPTTRHACSDVLLTLLNMVHKSRSAAESEDAWFPIETRPYILVPSTYFLLKIHIFWCCCWVRTAIFSCLQSVTGIYMDCESEEALLFVCSSHLLHLRFTLTHLHSLLDRDPVLVPTDLVPLKSLRANRTTSRYHVLNPNSCPSWILRGPFRFATARFSQGHLANSIIVNRLFLADEPGPLSRRFISICLFLMFIRWVDFCRIKCPWTYWKY